MVGNFQDLAKCSAGKCVYIFSKQTEERSDTCEFLFTKIAGSNSAPAVKFKYPSADGYLNLVAGAGFEPAT